MPRRAAERGAADYLLAHLAAPTAIDRRVATRSALIRPQVEKSLRLRRDAERDRVDLSDRLPLEAEPFARRVAAETQAQAFRGLVEGSKRLLDENPRTSRDLRRIARDGTLADAGGQATIRLRGESREVVLVKLGDRWFVDDAQTAPKPPPAP